PARPRTRVDGARGSGGAACRQDAADARHAGGRCGREPVSRHGLARGGTHPRLCAERRSYAVRHDLLLEGHRPAGVMFLTMSADGTNPSDPTPEAKNTPCPEDI